MDEKMQHALKQGIMAGLAYGVGISWWYDDLTRGLLTGIPFTIFMVGLFWFQKRSEEKKKEENSE